MINVQYVLRHHSELYEYLELRKFARKLPAMVVHNYFQILTVLLQCTQRRHCLLG